MHSQSPSYKAKVQIGGAHVKKQFNLDENAFHRTDMPPKARAAKAEVLEMLTKSISDRNKEFKLSTTSGMYRNGMMKNSYDPVYSEMPKEHMNYNQKLARDYKSLKLGPYVEESSLERPIDFSYPMTTKNAEHIYSSSLKVSVHNPESTQHLKTTLSWNSSNQFAPKKLELAGSKKVPKLDKYLKPWEAEQRFLEGKRAQKEMTRRHNELVQRSSIKLEEPHYAFNEAKPYSEIDEIAHGERMKMLEETYTADVLNAYLTHLIPTADYSNTSEIRSNVTSAPTQSNKNKIDQEKAALKNSSKLARAAANATQCRNIEKTYYHVGSWSIIPTSPGNDAGPEYAWSCCLSNTKGARGCTVVIHNKDRWNFANPTS